MDVKNGKYPGRTSAAALCWVRRLLACPPAAEGSPATASALRGRLPPPPLLFKKASPRHQSPHHHRHRLSGTVSRAEAADGFAAARGLALASEETEGAASVRARACHMLGEQQAAASSSGVDQQERSSVEGDDRRRRQPVAEDEEEEEEPEFRDIHALSPPPSQPSSYRRAPGEPWGSAAAGGSSSSHTSVRSVGSDTAPSEPFQTMSREFSAMVAAAASANAAAASANGSGSSDAEIRDRDVVDAMGIGRIGEAEEELEETNPLAIVPDSNPIPSPRRGPPRTTPGAEVALAGSAQGHGHGSAEGGVSVGQVKKEEVESKIAAWQIAEVAKVNNRFKREEVVINGWEGDQVEKASAWLKKYERKLEEKRAKAMEKAQNEVAKARRKAEEKRASAEAKRGTKVARVLELANFMRAVGRAPSAKRSFF